MSNNMDLNYEMFCYQCEQTANGKGCTRLGVCGKTPEIAGLQDLLIFQVKGISYYGNRLLENGEEVEKNLRKAQDYLIRAMRQGDPEALFIRGNQLYSGEWARREGVRRRNGEEKDLKRALQLFLDAGARGSADAMCSAGAMVYNGEGQEKDLKKAFQIYSDAASLGSLPALKNVGMGRAAEA